MRTTIDFRDDLMSELQERASKDGITLKDAVNNYLALALRGRAEDRPRWKPKSYGMGGEAAAFRKAWKLVDALEEESMLAKRELRK